MALQRTLELLKAGERINDRLYASTTEGWARPSARRWTYRPLSGSIRSLLRVAPRPELSV